MVKKSIKELHNEYNEHPELTNYYLNYQYNEKTKEWKFMGYRCTSCGRSFKQPNTLPTHIQHCSGINNPAKYKTKELTDEATVLTNKRTSWRPFDMNQK